MPLNLLVALYIYIYSMQLEHLASSCECQWSCPEPWDSPGAGSKALEKETSSPISSTIRHRRFSKFDELLSRDVIADFIGKPVFGSTGVHRNFNFKPSLIL